MNDGTLSEINDFFGQKRLAIVGVSRKEIDYGRQVFRELRKRSYDVVPVNPSATEFDGVASFGSVSDVAPAVDGALILLPAAATVEVARECVEAGVRRIWIRSDSPEVRELCRSSGTTLISGYCPFMFMSGAAFIHNCHAFGLKLAGRYPSVA